MLLRRPAAAPAPSGGLPRAAAANLGIDDAAGKLRRTARREGKVQVREQALKRRVHKNWRASLIHGATR
eukprot:3743574-Pyramimonas_sp.AAC.1